MAPDFDRRRALPAAAVAAIRDAVLAELPLAPALLDLGCGSGRIGWPFVAAGDRYAAADLSWSMLRTFAARGLAHAPALACADGAQLPFPDAAFDAVLLVQVLSGTRDWRSLLLETHRVIRPGGVLFVGRSLAPEDGVDARMKQRLADLLAAMELHPYDSQPKEEAFDWLASHASCAIGEPTRWPMTRSPRQFIERHGMGARFSALDPVSGAAALARLAAWAATTFGSLDAEVLEEQRFELRAYRFHREVTF